MFRNLLINTCTVQRYVPGVADAYGAPARAWVDFLIDQPCRLSSPSGRQVQASTEVVPVDAILFIEEVDVTEADRVVVDDISWEILFVAPLQDGVGGHHLELGLRRVKP